MPIDRIASLLLHDVGHQSSIEMPLSIPAAKPPRQSVLICLTIKRSPIYSINPTSTTMKLTSLLLALGIAPLALAATLPPPARHPMMHDGPHPHHPKMIDYESALVEPRSLADDIRTKKRCDSMFKSDKTPYRDACANWPDDDSANLCMLRALVGDASVDCRAALMKTMGF